MTEFDQDPIIALSTSEIKAAIAVIRITGKISFEKIDKFIIPIKKGLWKHGCLRLCNIWIEDKILDKILSVRFYGPKTFTGQDMIEIHCHGSPYIISEIMSYAVKNGIRMAEPGEFSKRAYLNNKMDLVQTEGLNMLINSKDKYDWTIANNLIKGKLSSYIKKIKEKMIYVISILEANINFPNEDIDNKDDIYEILNKCLYEINEMIRNYDEGKILQEGIKVSIIGDVNVGKSTLFNNLLAESRAITSSNPGTTRDYISETCIINGRKIKLFDSAGIRSSSDIIENMGMEYSIKLIEKSDIVIFANSADSKKNEYLINKIDKSKCIYIITKSDLGLPDWANDKWIPISNSNAQSIEKLKLKISDLIDQFYKNTNHFKDIIINIRHKSALDKARKCILNIIKLKDKPEEIIVFELQETISYMQEIIGYVKDDDILNKIFSNFCIGK